MKHVVNFSTGLASAEVAWRVAEQHGAADVVLLTADTLAEDADNWRFAGQVAHKIGARWVVLEDGRTPMEAGRDERCVPNDRWAVCSKLLKRKILNAWRDANCDPEDTIIYIGYDWTEPHRVAKAREHWAPWTVDCPLTRPPYLYKPELGELFRDRGIKPPRLYGLGFQHANCGGACVRGGQAQWSLLLQVNRDRYLEWEGEEEETRAMLGKDVSIMTEQVRGRSRPLPLRAFRERIEAVPTLFDASDWGACGCME